jgi:hypothetical protein
MKLHRFIIACLMSLLLAGSVSGQCDCQGQWDPNYNGIAFEIGDAVLMYNMTFIGIDPLYSMPCPCGIGDIDCSGVRDVVDFIKMISVITGEASPEQFCSPDLNCSVAHCLVPVPLTPGGDVYVESKTVPAGALGVEVGIYLYNDQNVEAVVLPLEIRSLSPGSYVAGSVDVEVRGRLATTGLVINAFTSSAFDTTPAIVGSCSGPIANTYDSAVFYSQAIPSSPMGMLWAGISTGAPGWQPPGLTTYDLQAGFDGYPGNGVPSLVLKFDVTSTPGQFEIDTCCWAPANHLAFVASDFETVITPGFSKGIVTIGDPIPPDCSCHADPRCDGLADVIDIVGVVRAAFGGGTATVDAGCPVQREDVDCSSAVDLVDVVKMINVAFRGFDPQSEFCDP